MTKPYRYGRKDWRDLANCSDAPNPEDFYPDPSDLAKHAEVIEEFCDGCPVKADCLADDLAAGGKHWGIRGGLSAADRDELVDRGPAAAASSCRNGHVFTPGNTGRDHRGRRCLSCVRDARDRARAREGVR